MATKEKWRTKAARMREEARETGKVILRAPALVRTAECTIRFLLGALLSGAEIFGGYGPSCAVTGTCPEGKMSCGNPVQVENGVWRSAADHLEGE